MSTKANVDESSLVTQLGDWVTAELTSQTETIKHLSEKLDALQNLVEASGVVEKMIFGEENSALPPSACAIDVTCLPPYMTNLYALEFTSDGIPYRWSGPGKSTSFMLSVDRTKDRQLEIGILGASCPDVVAQVTLHIDEVEIPAVLTDSALNATLPALETAQNISEIVLTLATTTSPNSISGSDDMRLLGVAISGLSIK